MTYFQTLPPNLCDLLTVFPLGSHPADREGTDWFPNRTPLWSSKGCSSPTQVLPCSDPVVLRQQVESFVHGGFFYSAGETQISTCNTPRCVLVQYRPNLFWWQRSPECVFPTYSWFRQKKNRVFFPLLCGLVPPTPCPISITHCSKNFQKSQF